MKRISLFLIVLTLLVHQSLVANSNKVKECTVAPIVNAGSLMKSLGNNAYHGNYLRLNKHGELMPAKSDHFSGCKWEFVKVGDHKYLIKSVGDNRYSGYYLRLHKDGRIVISKDAKYSGCEWQLQSQGGISRIKSLANNAYKGYYLRLDKNGYIRASKESKYSGCDWEIIW